MAARCRASRCIRESMKRYLPFIIIVVVLIAVIGIFAFTLRRGSGDSGAVLSDSNQSNSSSQSAPTAGNNASPNPSSSNSAGLTKPNVKVSSPVVLEEYGDYQCPPCGQLYPDLKQLEHEYGNQLQIVFHHFPLMKIHKNALAAAHAAEAARNQNKFWEMHDRLYRNQKEWVEQDDPRPIFLSYARQLNLNESQFKQDMESNLVDQRISADIQRGAAAGVTGTPTVFLDGNMVKYEATNADGLRRGINVMLERKAAR
jgi:protein-disulfide isomerase